MYGDKGTRTERGGVLSVRFHGYGDALNAGVFSDRTQCLRSEEGKRKMAERTSSRKVRVGTVVSDKMDKSIVVNVETRMPHPLYGKIVRRSRRYTAHDENNQCSVGDLVRIMETRPISRTKRWRLVEIVEKAE